MNHHEPLDIAIMGIQPRHKFPLSPGFRDNAKIREGLLKDQDSADELWRGFLCGLLGVATEVRGWCHGLVKWIYHDLFFSVIAHPMGMPSILVLRYFCFVVGSNEAVISSRR